MLRPRIPVVDIGEALQPRGPPRALSRILLLTPAQADTRPIPSMERWVPTIRANPLGADKNGNFVF